MALEVGEVRAILSLDQSNFTAGLQGAFASIAQLGSKFGAPGAAVAAGAVATAFNIAFAAKVAEGVGNALKDAFSSAATFEQTKMAFETLFGGQEFLGEVTKFGVDTPFELPDLEAAAKKMKAYGFETEDIIPILTAAGDAAAAMGDPTVVDRVTRALGQMRSKGKVMAEEMNRQLIESGIPAWDYLAEAMGISTAEVIKLSEKGLIPADEAIKAIIDGIENGNMGGAMADQMETANGKLAMFRDSVELLKRDIGAPLVEAAGPFIDMAIGGLTALNDIVGEFLTVYGPELERFWQQHGPTISAAVVTGINAFLLFTDIVLTFAGAGMGAFNSFVEGSRNAFTAFKKLVYEYVVMPLNLIIDTMNRIANTSIPRINFSISGNTGTGIGGGARKGQIPMMADGGIVTSPTLAVVGEAGPEAVVPLSRLGGMGGVTFKITGSRADASAIAAEVRKVLRGEIGGALSRTALMGA
jgi:tape measure domain-containing protein